MFQKVSAMKLQTSLGIGSTALPSCTGYGPWASVTSPSPRARLAERLRRKADRIDPTRVRRPRGCLGEAHLRRVLTKYAAYYNELRTHRSLNKDAPIHRASQQVGGIVSAPILGGLHHHHCRI